MAAKWKIVEWFGRAETVHTLAQTEFARTLLWPAMMTAATGGAGVLGGVPAMYILVACALTFGAITTGILRASEYRERQSPLNKLAVLGVQAPASLIPAQLLLPYLAGNRQQRRAAQLNRPRSQMPPRTEEIPTLSSSTVVAGIRRQVDKMQLGVTLRNTATFPISCILESAETEISTLRPPRGTFPKPPSTLSPGAVFNICDDEIDMNGIPAGRMAGKLDLRIKYGLPGIEVYELRLVGDVHILMEDYGLITQVSIGWRN